MISSARSSAFIPISSSQKIVNRNKQTRTGTQKLWRKWLARRSRESNALTWERMNRFLKETFVFPYARVVHSIYEAKP